MKSKTIKVDYLARVEGEGSLYLKIKDNKVTDAQLKIFEPPRFFEALLRGRKFSEAPDITARICGICPVAYQMSAVTAMEAAAGITIDGPLRELRRLLYCGEWVESHTLHVYMLHAPDFLGFPDAITMAKDHPEIVKQGLELKKIGNELVSMVGGREIHPINVRVGGFYKIPTRRRLLEIRDRLEWAIEAARRTVDFTASLSFPDFELDYELVSLRHESEYPVLGGRLVSNKGLDCVVDEYDNHFTEEHVPHSNALHSVLNERGSYFVGPMARFALNFDRLPDTCQEASLAAGIDCDCRNPFQSIVIRSIEILYACIEALRIVDNYEEPDAPAVDVEPRQAVGRACTEAPRGILYHRYQIDDDGIIREAKIVPPTSQNQKTIENDLCHFVNQHIGLPDDQLKHQCEQAIRNYDPCISCATHFLKLNIDRE